MGKGIAVVLGRNGRTTTLFDRGSINLYVRDAMEWKLLKQIAVDIDTKKGIKGIRERLSEIIMLLGDTKTLVGKEIDGLPYNIFDMAGFNIFEIDGLPEEFLDYVSAEDVKEEPEEDISPQISETETGGRFFINLKKIQSEGNTLSSKQILLPFLKSSDFFELRVICSHIPPWFDSELEKLGMRYDMQQTGSNEYDAVIMKKACEELQKQIGG